MKKTIKIKFLLILIILSVFGIKNVGAQNDSIRIAKAIQEEQARIAKIKEANLNKDLLSNEEFFNQSEFIIEGKRLDWDNGLYNFSYDSKGNFNEDDIYTMIKFVVSNVYKGEKILIGDTILIVIHRGMITRYYEEYGIQQFEYIPPMMSSRDYSIDRGLNISREYPSILFCKKSDFPENPDTAKNYNHFLKLKYLQDKEKACIKLWGKITGLNNLIFNSREELHEYMKQFEGITIPIPQSELNRIKNEEKRKAFEELMQKKLEAAKKYQEELKKKKLLSNDEKSSNNLNIYIQNQAVNYNIDNAKFL